MAQEILLEKDGEIKKAYIGFSWTMFFFNIWVFICRREWKDAFLFFVLSTISAIYYVSTVEDVNFVFFIRSIVVFPVTLFRDFSLTSPELSFYFCNEVFLIYSLLFSYNTFYTRRFLEKGYKLYEPSEEIYSLLTKYNIYIYKTLPASRNSNILYFEKNGIIQSLRRKSLKRQLGVLCVFRLSTRRSGEAFRLGLLEFNLLAPVCFITYLNMWNITSIPMEYIWGVFLIFRTVVLYYYPLLYSYYLCKKGYHVL